MVMPPQIKQNYIILVTSILCVSILYPVIPAILILGH